jgi:hypothetical protein
MQLQGYADTISKLLSARQAFLSLTGPLQYFGQVVAGALTGATATVIAQQQKAAAELSIMTGETIGNYNYTPPARGGTYNPPSSGSDKNKLPPGIDFGWLQSQVNAEEAKKNAEEAKKAADAKAKREQEIADAMKRVADQIAAAKSRLVSALDSMTKALVDKTESLRSSGLQRTDIGHAISTARIISNLSRDTALQREFTAGYAKLRSKGFTNDMLDQLGITGTGSIRQLRSLLRSSDTDLSKVRSGLTADTQAAMKSAAQIEGKMIADAVSAALNEYFTSLGIKGKDVAGITRGIVINIQGGQNPAAVAAATVRALEAKIKK